ncbi:outer membrane protein assembly factor BamA [Seleniivibrio woodruffii]|uniref:Outer membrane protein assembly factor BamA n=1 Tax=Seleniivibrio woodruffii TaxID=1078050 RepID=A0A4R1KCZ4_9BACT|nr:outer membrane protein assembly factor BamA [Seleniivibrio woodruffii]TCK62436.1 Beta-barrel assembly machine subunit BamA [Seleniivibrio woodruffii]TVZ34446.1 Beta-barrel assembly machine subunit BamA [Seleniivibrio woodruffii]
MKTNFFFIALITLFSFNALAATIDSVEIKGNRRVPTATIQKYTVKEGTEFDLGAVDRSIKSLFASGLVTDAAVDMKVDEDRLVLVYQISEKPYVNSVYFNGNSEIKTRILEETVNPMAGQLLDSKKVETNLALIQEKYADEKFYTAKINVEVEDRNDNSVDIVYSIDEGVQAKIYDIKIVGNKYFSKKQILKSIETSKKGFWSWLSGSGKLKKTELRTDLEKIKAIYLKEGFAKVQVGEPDIVISDDKKKIYITLKINEGIRYKVANIEFSGYEHATLDELKKSVSLKTGDWFNVEMFQNDIKSVTSVFTQKGFAYANVDPDTSMKDDAATIDIKFGVEENHLVYINRINIRGNTKSRDNVIRREFDIVEGQLYNSALISDSKRHLEFLDFFDQVRVAETRVAEDQIDLDVDVNDKMTGMFSLAAGYSSVDKLIGTVSVTQKNLFGKGYELTTKGEFSSSRADYTISFVNPWLFDRPYSFSLDLFKTNREYDDYDKKSKGFAIGLGHQLIKRKLYGSVRFRYEENEIANIEDYAADIIKAQEGESKIISLTPSLKWSTTNHPYLPTKGNQSTLFLKLAGGPMGGDYTFGKLGMETSQYVTLFWKVVLMAHLEGGYIQMFDGKDAPIAERYRLGGMYSIRGYEYGDISPADDDGNKFGGTKFIQNNFELIFPVIPSAQIMGVVFFDQGQAYDSDEAFFKRDLVRSYGAGFRWYSPIGPLRFEYGQPINPDSSEGLSNKGRWEFSIGGMI